MKLWPGVLLVLVGAALGAGAVTLGPRLAEPYLPEMLQGKVELVEGEVTRKQREPDRLLLTVVTPRGAILATFTRRLPEVDLLVGEGDGLTLALRRFEPFARDPVIRSVMKKTAPGAAPAGAPARSP